MKRQNERNIITINIVKIELINAIENYLLNDFSDREIF